MKDSSTKTNFLIDTDAQISVIPATPTLKKTEGHNLHTNTTKPQMDLLFRQMMKELSQ